MEKVIEIDVYEKKDLFDKYKRKKVSRSLINCIIDETPEFKQRDNFKIIINSKLEDGINVIELIKQGFKEEYEKNNKKHVRIDRIQVIYLILGILILSLSIQIESEIFREVVLIIGWVFVWAMVELEIFTDKEEKIKLRKLKKLINSEIIVNKL